MNNMTGNPNQEIRPSIFGFETYPSNVTQPIDWSRIPGDPDTTPFAPPSAQITYPQPIAELRNFSFCTTQTPHPAQFPFPTSSSPILSSNHGFGFNPTPTVRCKRKTDSPPPTIQAYKQHITEEKMAEHMSRLHISSETAGTSKETDTDKTRRLYMCEEMRKLQSDSILPHSLLSRIQRPCTALVLWTPPRRLLDTFDNGNNNEENIPDNNRMEAVDGHNMDLDNV